MIPPAIRQGVKRGRKGSRRTDVKLSLQCQKEPAAPRHKITKILVQDSADLVPSFTGYCSSVHLFSSDSVSFLHFILLLSTFDIAGFSTEVHPYLKELPSEAKGSA